MINTTREISCESCDAEFEVIFSSFHDHSQIEFCPVCGEPTQEDLDEFLEEFGED